MLRHSWYDANLSICLCILTASVQSSVSVTERPLHVFTISLVPLPHETEQFPLVIVHPTPGFLDGIFGRATVVLVAAVDGVVTAVDGVVTAVDGVVAVVSPVPPVVAVVSDDVVVAVVVDSAVVVVISVVVVDEVVAVVVVVGH